jgi:two-component system, sensor histidine kinase PdtaS
MEQLFLITARSRGLSVPARYFLTFVLVLASLAARKALFGESHQSPYLLLYPAVVVAGVVFDRGTGIFATLLGGGLAVWLFVEPTRSFAVASGADVVALLVFLAIGLFTAFLLESLHIALTSLADERRKLETANRALHNVAEQKGTLLSEAVHRARNDLQRLSATIQLQAGLVKEPDARTALHAASSRISALARINARLDRHREDGLSIVDSKGFLEGLVEDMRDLAGDLRPIAFRVAAEGHDLPMARAVPIGLLVNELVGNALKYAFPDEMNGQLDVVFRREGDAYMLVVEDNGVGFDPTAPARGTGIGARISKALAGQLGGIIEGSPTNATGNRPGTRWVARIPVEGPE